MKHLLGLMLNNMLVHPQYIKDRELMEKVQRRFTL